jgi:hypothetical protein
LWRSSDSGHCKSLFLIIVGIVEVVFTLTEVNYFGFIILQEKQVGWFDVSMTYSFALQERTGRNKTAVHGGELRLCPKHVRLLSFAIKGLKIS